MKPKLLLTYVVLLSFYQVIKAQDFAKINGNSLLLSNGIIEREVEIENGKILTKSLLLKGNNLNFNSGRSDEFSLLINGSKCDGRSGWDLISIIPISDDYQGSGALVKLGGTNAFSGIEVDITYLLYPDLPVIRKQISISNNTGKEIMIESFDIERLVLGFGYIHAIAYTSYGKQKHLSTYIGDWDDPVIAVHSYNHNAGILLGNESPGVLKRTAYNTEYNNVEIGLTHKDQEYPFRKYIKNTGEWTSPYVFVIPYANSSDPWEIMNTSLADFVRRHMGLPINHKKKRPTFMYNTWRSFREELSDTAVLSVAKVASKIGVTHFTIDHGWYIAKENLGKQDVKTSIFGNTGDWVVDSTKFPNGLKPVFNEIRKLKMKPGLWISIATAAVSSEVLQDHPEWVVKDEKGNFVNLHAPRTNDYYTMCLATDWMVYIKDKILNLVKDLGLAYVKLDLAVLTSAYVTETSKSGCYAKDHPYHKDQEESLIVIYERLFELFDELHAEVPDLYIDCTFEVAGKMQLIDYAFCQHAEGNWLTNIEDPFPVGAFRIRNLAWWKCPSIPASSLIIGNLQMDSQEFIHELKTLIGTFPIALGDLRNLSEEKKKKIRQWTDWISEMQVKYDYDLFRQDLPGFGEPMEGAWDGWSRLNTDTKDGGIVGVFRQGSLDNERIISVHGLDGESRYEVRLAPLSEYIVEMTGKDLGIKGFKVKMTEKYGSMLFEIKRVK